MEKNTNQRSDRVRTQSGSTINKKVDERIMRSLKYYRTAHEKVITERITELDKEWDIERALQFNAGTVSLTGLALGAAVHKRWFILPAVAAGFLLQHAVQGWCPPMPILRRLGFRTRKEIEEERVGLKAIRNDFDQISATTNASGILEAVRS